MISLRFNNREMTRHSSAIIIDVKLPASTIKKPQENNRANGSMNESKEDVSKKTYPATTQGIIPLIIPLLQRDQPFFSYTTIAGPAFSIARAL